MEEIEYLNFRLMRLENRIKSIELSPQYAPIYSVDLGIYPSFTKGFFCNKSNSALKILCYSQNNAALTVKVNGTQHNFTLSPAIMSVVLLNKGNNTVEVTSTSTGGRIILELTEVE